MHVENITLIQNMFVEEATMSILLLTPHQRAGTKIISLWQEMCMYKT